MPIVTTKLVRFVVKVILVPILGIFFYKVIPPIVEPIIDHYFPPKEKPRTDVPTVNINVPSAFQVNYLYRDPPDGSLKPILPGSVLHSGDRYKVVFTPDRDGYVYLFQVDSTGQFFQLFPMREFKGVRVNNLNPVKAGQRYVLPAEDKAFKLDQIVGRERLLLAVTARPHSELESLAQKLNEARERKDTPHVNDLNRLLANRLEGQDGQYRLRGLDSVETDQVIKLGWEDQSGKVFETLGQKLGNLCENCVYGTEFEHR